MQCLFIKAAANLFVNIVLIFFSKSSILVLTSIFLVLFEVTFSFKFLNLTIKSVFFTKLVI